MKKGRIILGTVAAVTAIAGIFAFKTNKATVSNVYFYTAGHIDVSQPFPSCVYPSLKAVCGTVTIPASTIGTYYYTSAGNLVQLPGSLNQSVQLKTSF